jgi:hypothetical protein
MGIRGEIFSTKVALVNRTYFFNVKENRLGDLYLNIVESKNKDTGGFDRQSVILFADDVQEFLSGFDESLQVLEKAVRERRKTAGPGRRGNREGGEKNPRQEKYPEEKKRPLIRRARSGTKPKEGGSPGPHKSRRVVVKKNPKDN